jgi:DNA-binding response OmpR family regulator
MKGSEIISSGKPAIALVRVHTNSSHRILVVDDDKDIRQFSVDVLADSGYDVEGVKDGAAGWRALQAKNYDLVITDNKMPRMTGIEMIEKLRDAYMTLPVIMATRFLPADELARKPWLRPDAMLERPFSNDDLLAAVKKILHTDDGSDELRETLLPKYL